MIARTTPKTARKALHSFEAQPDPLGPDSLTWKYFGDLRTGMLGVWIGAIQNIYPELGRRRGGPFGSAADYAGRRYHALNPETFYWAHATFFMLIIKTAEYFCGGLTEAEKRQLFDEHVQWYRMYGMSMRPVPESWEEFCEYWDRKCREELEINQATLDIFSSRIPKPWFVLMPTPDAPWSRHPLSWARLPTAAGSRCTTSRAAIRCSTRRGRWCTRRSLWRGCVRPRGRHKAA